MVVYSMENIRRFLTNLYGFKIPFKSHVRCIKVQKYNKLVQKVNVPLLKRFYYFH